jgi:hypothetical protein
MGPVKEEWAVEYASPINGAEIHSFEEWDSFQSMDVPIHERRRTAGLWTAIATLTVALAVAAVYGYSVISKYNDELAMLSARVNSYSGVPQQLNKLEAGLNKWNSGQENLAAQIRNMDAGWNSGLNDVRLHSAELVAYTNRKEHDELNQRATDLNLQIAGIASRENLELAHIAELEKELANARQDLALSKASYNRELAALQDQQVSSQQEINSLNDALSTNQVSFLAEKRHDAQVAQGVSLHLTGTDQTHQRFSGRIWIESTHRRIWVRNHPSELPVVFYPKSDGAAYELVVTRVNRNDVSGYLLLPTNSNSSQQNLASNNRSITAPGQDSF